MISEEAVWQALEAVKDPELPVVSLVEMGIVRRVDVLPERVVVTITPTFSGCPALHTMKADIAVHLRACGVENVQVETTFSPPWTSDWITDAAREKLRNFGLAPPPRHGGQFEVMLLDAVSCPYCGSENTRIRNSFGATPCRMIFYCDACEQPFEQFKPL